MDAMEYLFREVVVSDWFEKKIVLSKVSRTINYSEIGLT